MAAQIASQPLEAWKDSLRFHAIHDFADVLPRAFAEEALALRAATGAGVHSPPVPSARSPRRNRHERRAGEYDRASSDVAAYGSVGALIGHDVIHCIDVLGAGYDTEHRMSAFTSSPPRACESGNAWAHRGNRCEANP